MPRRHSWPVIQQYHDEGHSKQECMAKFGFNPTTWSKAYNSGKFVAHGKPKPPAKLKDMIGSVFGKLEVISQSNYGQTGIRRWLCKCACGNDKIATTAALRSGSCRSCGCLRGAFGVDSPRWDGHGEIGAAYWSSIQTHAIRHNRIIEFNLKVEDVWKLFLNQDRRCAISGREIGFGSRGRKSRTASLDRIDSALGYTIDNVWWVHKDVNYIKMDFKMDEFLGLIKEIYEFQQGRRFR